MGQYKAAEGAYSTPRTGTGRLPAWGNASADPISWCGYNGHAHLPRRWSLLLSSLCRGTFVPLHCVRLRTGIVIDALQAGGYGSCDMSLVITYDYRARDYLESTCVLILLSSCRLCGQDQGHAKFCRQISVALSCSRSITLDLTCRSHRSQVVKAAPKYHS